MLSKVVSYTVGNSAGFVGITLFRELFRIIDGLVGAATFLVGLVGIEIFVVTEDNVVVLWMHTGKLLLDVHRQ